MWFCCQKNCLNFFICIYLLILGNDDNYNFIITSVKMESLFPSLLGWLLRHLFKAYARMIYSYLWQVKRFQICVLWFLHTNEHKQTVWKHYRASLVKWAWYCCEILCHGEITACSWAVNRTFVGNGLASYQAHGMSSWCHSKSSLWLRVYRLLTLSGIFTW